MKKSKKRSILAVVLVLIFAVFFVGRSVIDGIFGRVVDIDTESIPFYIHTGWGQEEVLSALSEQGIVEKTERLSWLMDQKNYQGNNVVSGKYTILNGLNANELIDHLRAGNGEEEVRVSFNASRTLYDLAGIVSKNIEADSTSLVALFFNPEIVAKYGLSKSTFKSMFLPDTYQMEWDTDAEEFLQRMATEYKAYWNDDRKRKARNLNLSQSEVTTLASIVQAEQQAIPAERPAIAGLYINRLKRGMRLQSDPTVIYAIGDFGINRVLTKHLSYDSPYNTYKYAGLPPGPINIPAKQSIDAVLNAESHRYIYMCAKADFSGYHAFASSLSQHNRNAREFQAALNKRKIYR